MVGLFLDRLWYQFKTKIIFIFFSIEFPDNSCSFLNLQRKKCCNDEQRNIQNLLLYLYFGISCSSINMEVSLFQKTYFVKNELYIFKYVFLHRSFFSDTLFWYN